MDDLYTAEFSMTQKVYHLGNKTNCIRLESMDIHKNIITDQNESRRWQFERAVSAMLPQNDYTAFKRNIDDVARGMDRLKAIGNGQVPLCMAYAFCKLFERITKEIN